MPSWLSSDASPALPDVDDALAPRVPLPAPVGLIGQIPPVPSVIPDPVERARRVAAEEAARVFSSEAGVPTVFVGRPPADVTCRVCRDGFLDPVIADDGFTYCRRCVPSATADDHPGALGAEHLAPDHEARAKVAASLVLCRNGLKISTTPTASIDGSTTRRDASSPSRTNLAPRTRTSAGTRARRVAFPGWAAASIVVRRSCFAERASRRRSVRIDSRRAPCPDAAGRCNTTEKRSTCPGASFEPRSVPTDADGAVVGGR